MSDTNPAYSKQMMGPGVVRMEPISQDAGSRPATDQKASGSASNNPRAGAGGSADARAAPADTAASQSTYKAPNKYRYIKDNWDGKRLKFQYSHGLRTDLEDWEVGDRILEGYIESERLAHGDLAWEDRKGTTTQPLFAIFFWVLITC